VTQRHRPSKHITLAPALLEKVEADAQAMGVTVSEVIESHLQSYYAGGGCSQQLDRLESSLNALKAEVLPLVARVNALLQQVEQETSNPPITPPPAVKIATYDDIYVEESPPTREDQSGGEASRPWQPIGRRWWGR
jgi:hypothetical protein